MNKNYYAIVMAGGIGSRFWPVSKETWPKQFHDMLGTGQTLLQKTVSRLEHLIPKNNIFILTNARYQELVLEQLPEFQDRQVILEPAMRNTAPCILMAALKIHKDNPDAVMVVAPSDHWIEDDVAFTNNLKQAFDVSQQSDMLMTLGIQPTFPNTGYGYIEFENSSKSNVKKVKQFREKPDYKTAKQFLEQKTFLWNAGIFIWSTATVLAAFEQHQPQLYELLAAGIPFYNTAQELAFVTENYPRAENISVDYALMETSLNVFVIPATFDWNDLGTWGSLYDKTDVDNNANAVINADLLATNSKGNLIKTSDHKIVVLEGLNDFIVVEEEEILLIFPKSKEQDIKQLRENVKNKFGKRHV